MSNKYKKEKKEFKNVIKMWKKASDKVDNFIKKDLKSPSYNFK